MLAFVRLCVRAFVRSCVRAFVHAYVDPDLIVPLRKPDILGAQPYGPGIQVFEPEDRIAGLLLFDRKHRWIKISSAKIPIQLWPI